MFSTSAIGIVLSPEVVEEEGIIYCSYPNDGNSMNSGNWGCDGATAWGAEGLRLALSEQARRGRDESCLWGAPTAEDRSHCRYNEVVLLWGEKFLQQLPRIVEAFFYPIRGRVDSRERMDVIALRSRTYLPTGRSTSIGSPPSLTYIGPRSTRIASDPTSSEM